MDPIRTLIVDDEPLARRRIAQLLAEAPEFVLCGECRNGTEAVHVLAADPPTLDLVFLDVQMPDLSGLQVLQHLPPPRPLIVFVTAYDRYTLPAFEAHAVDYLLKPLDPDRFKRCLAHARRLVEQQRASQRHMVLPPSTDLLEPAENPVGAEQFLIKQQGRLYFVKTEQVSYLESTGNYVMVHTQDEQHLIRSTLSQLERKLDPQRFLRIHRSYIINCDYLKELRPWTHREYLVTLHDDTHLTSSRSYSDRIQRFLQRFTH